MSQKPHFFARKVQDWQRLAAQGYVCPICNDGFQQEPHLWEHAKHTHQNDLGVVNEGDERAVRTRFQKTALEAANKTSRRVSRGAEPIKSNLSSNDNDSMIPNLGAEDVRSTSSVKPVSAPGSTRDPENKINDIEKLTLSPAQLAETPREAQPGPLSSFNPLKRGAVGESELPRSSPDPSLGDRIASGRRTKALSGGPFTPKDPDFDREGSRPSEPNISRHRQGSTKRLFDPSVDNPNSHHTNRRGKVQESAMATPRIYNKRTHIFRSRKAPSGDKDELHAKILTNNHNINEQDSQDTTSPSYEPSKFGGNHIPSQDDTEVLRSSVAIDWEPEPEILLQPETRPISHEQLLVEVKGIYAGLVMVEAKCIDVDDKQSQAAQEKDPSRQTSLSNEQLQALIALHKTLLHEHHDFFLASQHPSASPALSRLAAKYTMPARMWRHGIHAFLEVLRHRLPQSLDHMLAFIYIAYSMVALLYETVSTFEDTWVECLGDLGRYRMAIEDDDIRDREVWSGVARFWYSKAADKSPDVGRLYHHLAILARPYTLQQLSLYTRALTCVAPFESARGSIMMLFTPILNGKESSYHRSSSFETKFIKAHGLLFTGKSLKEFDAIVNELNDGVLDNYIGRVTAKFKEQSVYVAVTNIAALFEYGGIVRQAGPPTSIFGPAFEALRESDSKTQAREQQSKSASQSLFDNSFDVNSDTAGSSSLLSNQATLEGLTSSEMESSMTLIRHASKLAFVTFALCLQRIGDKNVLPLLGVYFIFLYDLTRIKNPKISLESYVPWAEMCAFLNALAKPDALTSRIFDSKFPGSKEPPPLKELGSQPRAKDSEDRPLPEDFIMRGQWYFPKSRFNHTLIDDEERSIEQPSMAAARVERILWAGYHMGSSKDNTWIYYDPETRKFSTKEPETSLPVSVDDNTMSGFDADEDFSKDENSESLVAPDPLGSANGGPQLMPSTEGNEPTKTNLPELAGSDIIMADADAEKPCSLPSSKVLQTPNIMIKTRDGVESNFHPKGAHEIHYAFDPRKLEKMRSFDRDINKEYSKT